MFPWSSTDNGGNKPRNSHNSRQRRNGQRNGQTARSNQQYGQQCVGHSHSHNNHQFQPQFQAQSQKMMSIKQQTLIMETFAKQVDDTLNNITMTAKMSQNDEFDESTKTMLGDNAIMSLNMFAVSCEEIHKQSNQDALDLATKKLLDKFQDLRSQEPAVYRQMKKHREFMEAALAGHKGLRYKEERVETSPSHKQLFQNNPEVICQSFSKVIGSNQQFYKKQDEVLADHEKYAQRHKSELNEYRSKQNKNKYSVQKKSKYVKPNQAELYFNEDGRKSKFVNKKAMDDQKEMDDAMMGNVDKDLYDELPLNARNAVVWYTSDKCKGRWVCCQILPRHKLKKQNKKKALNYIVIELAAPYNTHRRQVTDLSALRIDPETVRKAEKKHIAQHQQLGYPAIDDDDAMDVDF